ncbi:outer membrane chaperone Skp [Celeribacter ethanolicus]|uniref:Outer membrane chaperone Skp n=1 Tax=Celeribacter ethanolicus TaxID=1758178 RepID=A0A291G9C8_9RHOB|nr:OmpH family outer membrane protein [Celeribacter ethanolicus]ATG46767.1 outer membrane chaperone Skp [Celeribacter ethanolicus]
MRRAAFPTFGLCFGLSLALCFAPLAVRAQDTGATVPPETEKVRTKLVFPVLVFDRDRVIASSAAGAALEARGEAARNALLEENKRIYDELEAEEQALADIRDSLSEAEFRARAQAFDEKVVAIRAEQDQKAQAIQTQYDDGLAGLEEEMNKALTGLARDFGAVLVFERGQVYLMSGAIDVSGLLIERLDAEEAETPADAPAASEPD